MRDAETVRLLQAVYHAVSTAGEYLWWLWWSGVASWAALGVSLLNAAALAWVVRRMIKWEGAGK